jgi:hypothetical protein
VTGAHESAGASLARAQVHRADNTFGASCRARGAAVRGGVGGEAGAMGDLMPPRRTTTCQRWRVCSKRRSAWLPAYQSTHGAMVRYHLLQPYPTTVGPFPKPLPTMADIARVAAQGFEGLTGHGRWGGHRRGI